jgi:hypothetical protein
VFDCLLNRILSVAIVLVLADGGGDVIREVLIEYFVDCRHAGCLGAKKTHLLRSHGWAEVIYPQRFEEARLDGITFTPGGRHFGTFAINKIQYTFCVLAMSVNAAVKVALNSVQRTSLSCSIGFCAHVTLLRSSVT